jgi:hypothetical protein
MNNNIVYKLFTDREKIMSTEFTANIISINNGARFQITIPKKDVDAGLIDPKKSYRVKLVPIEKESEVIAT